MSTDLQLHDKLVCQPSALGDGKFVRVRSLSTAETAELTAATHTACTWTAGHTRSVGEKGCVPFSVHETDSQVGLRCWQ